MWGYHDVTDTSDAAMEPPVCWITNAIDRSPAEIVRVESDGWGPLKGSLLNLSYGYGKIFVVPHEIVGDRMQGGMCRPADPAVPHRHHARAVSPRRRPALRLRHVRLGGQPRRNPAGSTGSDTPEAGRVPVGLSAARRHGDHLQRPARPRAAADRWPLCACKVWGLKRTENTAPSTSTRDPARSRPRRSRPTAARSCSPSRDRADWCMEITYAVTGADGTDVRGTIDNTIHRLRDLGTGGIRTAQDRVEASESRTT